MTLVDHLSACPQRHFPSPLNPNRGGFFIEVPPRCQDISHYNCLKMSLFSDLFVLGHTPFVPFGDMSSKQNAQPEHPSILKGTQELVHLLNDPKWFWPGWTAPCPVLVSICFFCPSLSVFALSGIFRLLHGPMPPISRGGGRWLRNEALCVRAG